METQKPLKYKDLISQSQEEIQSERLELDVQKSKSKLEVDISQTKYDLAQAKQKLNDTKRAVPYCIQKELNAKAEVDSLEAGLKYAEEVLADRF